MYGVYGQRPNLYSPSGALTEMKNNKLTVPPLLFPALIDLSICDVISDLFTLANALSILRNCHGQLLRYKNGRKSNL